MGKRVNENYFEKIDSEEKAYFLGFIYADGSVSSKGYTLVLGLAEKDGYIVEKFAECLETDYKVRHYIQNTTYKDNFEECRITISNKKIKEDLNKLGVFPGKTLKCSFPTSNQVPDNLIHHFIRGFFDGDGSIKRINTNRGYLDFTFDIIGTKEMLTGLHKIFKDNIPEIRQEETLYREKKERI